MDLVQIALQEVALDGLEGSTFTTLVGHLKARSPPIDTVIDDLVKGYIWKGLLECGEVQAFLLDKNFDGSKQVETVKVTTKKRTGEADTLPQDWIYDKDKDICGYSPSYSHREDISEEIAGLNLSEAQERYGDQLVLVASQDLRFRTLVGESCSPEMSGTVSPIRYIILEIIGKTRKEGFLQMDMKKYDFDPRTSFHHIKILLQSNLVTKQPRVITVVPGRMIRTKLLFLKNFHRQSLKRSSVLAEKICAVLCDAPDGILELKDLKRKMHLEPFLAKQFKRARQWLYSNGYLQYIYDGKILKVEKQRLLASRPIYVQLVKMYEPEPDDVENEDEVEENWVSRCKSLDPQLVNEINVDQHSYLVLTGLKEEGVTINEIAEKLCIPHFWGRSLLQSMHSSGHCSTIMLTKEKQRLKKVVSYLFLHKNKTVKTLKVLTGNGRPKSSETQHLSEGSEPGKADKESKSSPKSSNDDLERTSDDFSSEMPKTDMTGDLALQENRKLAESLNLGDFRLSSYSKDLMRDPRGLEREKFLLRRIQDAGATSNHVMLYKALLKEEAMKGSGGTCCRKSFFRTLCRMEKNGVISVHRFEFPQLPQKPVTVYCSPGTSREDDAVKKDVEEVTFRLLRGKKEKKKGSKDSDKAARQEQARTCEAETDTDDDTCQPLKGETELRPLARFSRIKHLHLFLWQLLYGDRNEEGHTTFQGGKVNLCLNEKIEDFDFLNIKRKLPSYAKGGHGWFKVGDVLSVLPLVLFGECGGMRGESKTFNNFMKNPKKRLMLMSEFPPKLTAKLLNTKEKLHILGSVIHCLVVMVEMDLVRVISDTLPISRHECMLYLTKETLLWDTTESQRAYCETALPPGMKEFPVFRRKFDTLDGVFKYWADLQFICLNTPLGIFGKDINRGLPKKRSANPYKTLRDFQGLFSEETITTQETRLLGDGRGAAGLDSMLYSHLARNWNYERIIRARNTKNMISTEGAEASKLEVPFARAATLKKMKILKRKKLRLPREKKKEADSKRNKGRTSINKGMPSSKVNKKLDGGAASRLLAFHQRHEALKRIKQQRKRYAKVLDEVDSKALGERKSFRPSYSPKEDAMILYGVVALHCMKLNYKVYSPWELVRNVMHKEHEESRDKTTESIQRRSRKIMQCPETKAIMKAFVVECYDHEDFAYARNFNDSNWKQYFEDIFHKLRKKYKDQINPWPTTFAFPKSQEECQRDFVIKEMWDTKPTIKPPTNVTEITRIVLKDLIHNSVGARQSPEFLPVAVFEILSSYPKEEIDRAVLDLKRRGLICRVKYDLPRHRGLPISTLRYDLSTWYDRSLDNVIPPKTYSLARQVRKGTLSLLEFESGLRTEMDEKACNLPCYHLENGFFSHNQDGVAGGLIAFLLSLMARNEAVLQVGLPDRTLRDRRELDAEKEHGSEKQGCNVSRTRIHENQDDSVNSNDISMPPLRTGIKRKRGYPAIDMEGAKKFCSLKRSTGSFSAIDVTCAYLHSDKIAFFRRTCVDQSHVDFAFSEKAKQDSDSDIYREYQPGRKFLSQLKSMLQEAEKDGKDVKHPTIKQDDFALIPFDVRFKEDIKPFYECLPSLNVIADEEVRSQQRDYDKADVDHERSQRDGTGRKGALQSSICVRYAEEDDSVISRFLQTRDILTGLDRFDKSSERELDGELYFSALSHLTGFKLGDIDLNRKLYNTIRAGKELGATFSSLKRLFASQNSNGESKISLEVHLQEMMNFEKVMEVGALEKRYVAWSDRLAWCMKTPLFTTETMNRLTGFKSLHSPKEPRKGPMNESNFLNFNKEALRTNFPTESALISPVRPDPSTSFALASVEEENDVIDDSANQGETAGPKSSKREKGKEGNKRKGEQLSPGGAKRSKVDAGEKFRNEFVIQGDDQPLNRVRRVTRMRPWLGLSAELSPLLLKRIQSAVLSYISFHPGVTKKALMEKYGFLLRPVALEEILQCLTLNMSITEHYMPEKVPQKGPFAKREYQVDRSNPYYLPSMSCFFNIVDVDRICPQS